MRLLLFGATGRVGRHVLDRALGDGHEVTAFVRNPEKLTIHHPRLTLIQGDARQKTDVDPAVKGKDAVISALGTDGGTTLTEFVPLIIEAMKKEQVKRIITVGTAGILQSRTTSGLLRYQSPESKRALKRAAEEHHKAYLMLAASGLEWTVVCPTYLPDGERLGEYRVERDYLPEGGASISVPDTADFVYSQLVTDQYVRSRVGIAY
jgi:putative NADH-flavin reductase